MRLVRFLLLGCAISLAAAAPASADDEAGWAASSVVRATFTSGVEDREPLDSVAEVKNDHRLIYFFSEFQNMSGEMVTHRWEYNGQVMAEIPFHVGGPRWRVWSSKNLEPYWLGQWTVTLVNAEGTVLESKSFRYSDAAVVPANSVD